MEKTKDSIRNTLNIVILELSNLEINFELSFNENGINSVLLVKIFIRMEELYNIEFDEHDFDNDRFESVNEFINFLYNKINNINSRDSYD